MDIPAIILLFCCVAALSVAALVILSEKDRNIHAVIFGSIWVTLLTVATIAQGVVILVWLNTPQ